MKPAPFEYIAPTTVEAALKHLAAHGDEGKLLAGGQSLIPTMNFRLAQPSVLIDLNPLQELAYIEANGDGGLRIGAMTRQRAVERSDLVAAKAPLVHDTMPYIAHSQIRNRGTFGGSIAHADPAAELPALMVALDARILLRSQRGERWVAASDFYLDLFTTALEPDELLVEVSLPPMAARSGWGFKEVARRHGDYAIVGACANVTLDAAGLCESAKLVFFSVGPGPVVAQQAATMLVGEQPTTELIAAVAETAATHDIEPDADIHASVAYRRHLARTLARTVLSNAVERAQAN